MLPSQRVINTEITTKMFTSFFPHQVFEARCVVLDYSAAARGPPTFLVLGRHGWLVSPQRGRDGHHATRELPHACTERCSNTTEEVTHSAQGQGRDDFMKDDLPAGSQSRRRMGADREWHAGRSG